MKRHLYPEAQVLATSPAPRVDNRSFCPTVFQSSLEAAVENQIANLPDAVFLTYRIHRHRERLSIRVHHRHNRFLNKAFSIGLGVCYP